MILFSCITLYWMKYFTWIDQHQYSMCYSMQSTQCWGKRTFFSLSSSTLWNTMYALKIWIYQRSRIFWCLCHIQMRVSIVSVVNVTSKQHNDKITLAQIYIIIHIHNIISILQSQKIITFTSFAELSQP